MESLAFSSLTESQAEDLAAELWFQGSKGKVINFFTETLENNGYGVSCVIDSKKATVVKYKESSREREIYCLRVCENNNINTYYLSSLEDLIAILL